MNDQFDRPKKVSACEEPDDDVVLVEDGTRRVIGSERLNDPSARRGKDGVSIPVDVHIA
jgi:hypothetical protein